jgi:hypothetical protein
MKATCQNVVLLARFFNVLPISFTPRDLANARTIAPLLKKMRPGASPVLALNDARQRRARQVERLVLIHEVRRSYGRFAVGGDD